MNVASTCAGCGAELGPSDAFCEVCGAEVVGTAGATGGSAGMAGGAVEPATPLTAATVVGAAPRGTAAVVCPACGGGIAGDGFCEVCGAKAPTWRDHWTEVPAPWVGAVCDKGILHARNEDAMAVAASPEPGGWSVLVVCDGVTSAPDSDQASLAAATEARDHLVGSVRAGRPVGGAADIETANRWLTAACRVAQVSVVAVTDRLRAAAPGGVIAEPPSCTFVAAVLVGTRLTVGWAGDSRAYWLPDGGGGAQLSTDHSLASELVAAGVPRAEAEQDPTAHTITRWLGADSPTPSADVASRDLDTAGWLLVCSDGLWNYASTVEELSLLVAAAIAGGATTPVSIAESLAAYANGRGGHDNISVCLARVEPPETRGVANARQTVTTPSEEP